MATENNRGSMTLLAQADYSAATMNYRFVKHGTVSRSCVLAGAGERVIGVLTNRPASGQAATVQTQGIAKVRAGAGTIAAGGTVASDAAGRVYPATGTDFVVGVAMEGVTAKPDTFLTVKLQIE
jgi:hypothetical protein